MYETKRDADLGSDWGDLPSRMGNSAVDEGKLNEIEVQEITAVENRKDGVYVFTPNMVYVIKPERWWKRFWRWLWR